MHCFEAPALVSEQQLAEVFIDVLSFEIFSAEISWIATHFTSETLIFVAATATPARGNSCHMTKLAKATSPMILKLRICLWAAEKDI